VGFQKLNRDFSNEGLKCAAWLYLPDNVENPPVVIMGHGFAAERVFALPAFAEYFVETGLAVLLFDYRNFGDSEGAPRNWVDPDRHLSDWKAALTHVRALTEIDSDRIGLWGSSFSGGHVLCTAADQSVRAVVSQVPYVGSNEPVKIPLTFKLKVIFLSVLNRLKLTFTGEPYWIPVVAQPGELGIMTQPEAKNYWSLIPDTSDWQNRVPVSILTKIGQYQPINIASRVSCPVLFVVGERDEVTPPEPVCECAKKIDDVEVLSIDCGHFDVYSGDVFNQVVTREAEFLSRHLQLCGTNE